MRLKIRKTTKSKSNMNFDETFIDDDTDLNGETDRGGIIFPKQNCEHVRHVHLFEKVERLKWKSQCIDCKCKQENWLCLSCGQSHCGRYQNNHGEEHWLFTLLTDGHENLGHCLTISLDDLSVWCYSCKSYIINVRLQPLIKHLESLKFPSESNEDSTISMIVPTKLICETPNVDKTIESTLIAIQDPLLLEEFKSTNLLSFCSSISLRSASIDELVELHSSDYVNHLVSSEKSSTKISDLHFELQSDEKSLIRARISAGTMIDAIETVVKSHVNGFVMTSSPGHRALCDHGNGTSIYNNIALAVKNILNLNKFSVVRKSSLALIDSNNHLHMEGATPIEDAILHMINVLTPATNVDQQRRSSISTKYMKKSLDSPRLDRILIVDLAAEHGCGLQSIFYETKQVFYLSIHNETHQHRSSYHECGKNEGLGYNMNIPLASFDQINDEDYVAVITELVLPICREYQPELIILTVDFQIPKLTNECYGWIVEQFQTIRNCKLVVAFDGDLTLIRTKIAQAETILSILLRQISFTKTERWQKIFQNEVQINVQHKIELIKEQFSSYWTCFQ